MLYIIYIFLGCFGGIYALTNLLNNYNIKKIYYFFKFKFDKNVMPKNINDSSYYLSFHFCMMIGSKTNISTYNFYCYLNEMGCDISLHYTFYILNKLKRYNHEKHNCANITIDKWDSDYNLITWKFK